MIDSTGLRSALLALECGDIAGIRVVGFAPLEVCKSVVDYYDRNADKTRYREENVKAAFVGVPAILFADRKDAYWPRAAHWRCENERWYREAGVHDPSDRMLKMVQQAFPERRCLVAAEGANTFFHGIIRNINRSPLHNDFAKRDFVGWRISHIDNQLSWNTYLTIPEGGGGHTLIYRKRWRPLDEKHKSNKAMGYSYAVVDESAYIEYVSRVGELFIFNCTHYHEVTASSNAYKRITVGGFIGVDRHSEELVFWS